MSERRSGPSWRYGFRPLAPLAVLWLGASAFLLVLIRQESIPYADLLLDPAQYDRRPWYTGLISNVGVLGWMTAVVVAAGGGWLAGIGGRSHAGQLLRGGALLSGLLLLDDLFQFHIIVPRTIGAPKMAFYGLYGVLGAAWAHSNRAEFIRTRWPLLIAALLALSASVAIDVVGDGRSTSLLAEDSAKFLGILAWALYFALTVGDICRSIVRQGRRAMESNDQPRPIVLAFDPDTDKKSDPTKRRSKKRKANAEVEVAEAETTTTGAIDGSSQPGEPLSTATEQATLGPEPSTRPDHGPSRRNISLDHLDSSLRSTFKLWLPLALLCFLCYQTVMLMIAG